MTFPSMDQNKLLNNQPNWSFSFEKSAFVYHFSCISDEPSDENVEGRVPITLISRRDIHPDPMTHGEEMITLTMTIDSE